MLHRIDTRALVAAFTATCPNEWSQSRNDPSYHVFYQIEGPFEAVVHWLNKFPRIEVRARNKGLVKVISKQRAMDLAAHYARKTGNEAVTAVFANLGKALALSPDKMGQILLAAIREAVPSEPPNDLRSNELDRAVQAIRTLFEKTELA